MAYHSYMKTTKELTPAEKAIAAAMAYLFNAAKEKHETTQEDVALAVGKSLKQIQRIKGGKSSKVSTLTEVAAYFGFTYENMLALGRWILDGKAPEEWKPSLLEESNVSPGPSILRKVPLISFIQAGDWSGDEEFEPEELITCTSNVGPKAFALRVKGPSMEPEFIEGDYIIIDPDKQWESGDYVVAKNGEEEATFKRYYKDGDKHFLKPLNVDWGKPKDMTGHNWRIVGRVMEKVKRY